MHKIILLTFCFLLLSFSAKAVENDKNILIGQALITDADTISIRNKKIRLQGIDAPEARQRCDTFKYEKWYCGHEATGFLIDLLKDDPILKCTWMDKDSYGRLLGTCYLPNGDSVNRILVRSGWAKSYTKYSREYEQDERFAESNKLGIWGKGYFMDPWKWREEQRLIKKMEKTFPSADKKIDIGTGIPPEDFK